MKCLNNNGTITSCEGQYTNPERVITFSASFTSCTFISLTTTDDGGAISFTSGSSLSVYQCMFISCSAPQAEYWYHGGGAVFSNTGDILSVKSSTFIACSTNTFGGGVLATAACKYCSVSLCSFFHCTAEHGGGVCVFLGPSSTVDSSRFCSCTASFGCGSGGGGGLYHDCQGDSGIDASNLLFNKNAAYSTGRGGGGFEDYRWSQFSITFSFSFFTQNTAPNGVGKDISILNKDLSAENIQHCFTTTSSKSFYNNGEHKNDWLPLTAHSLLLNKSNQPQSYNFL